MSNDPAAFVAGVPVKISEKYRPPPKVNLPASCQHQINSELLTHDYDFAVEKTTLLWVQERRNRLEKEERLRKERIAEYEKKKAEEKAKQEEEEKLKREEELLKQKEEEERLKKEERIEREEEDEIRRLGEEINQEQQTQEVESIIEAESGDVSDTPASEIHDTNGNETVVNSQENEVPQGASQTLTTSEDLSYCSAISSNVNRVNTAESNASSNTSYDLMLKPTPIPSQKSVRSPSKTQANINFADFEGEGNDPFDSAALKSINDMEELAKVLNTSHTNPKTTEESNTQHFGPSNDGDSYSSAYPNGQVSYGAFGQYPYFMPSHQQHPQQSLQQQSITHTRPGFPPYQNHIPKNPQVTRNSSIPSSVPGPQYSKDPEKGFQNKYYPQPWNGGYSLNSSSKAAQYVPYDFSLQSASITNNLTNVTQMGVMSTSCNKTENTSTLPVYTSGNSSIAPSGEGGTALSKRQDLEDFYSKYYSQNRFHQQSGAQSGESTPSHSSSSGAAGSTSGSLRSCRSVPDLTAAEDSEVTRYSSGLQSHSDSRGVSHTPPPRPSSTGLTGLEDWKPLPDISGLDETSSRQHSYHSSPGSHSTVSSSPHTPVKSRLPDPFAELTTDAQMLVQGMAEMGFPRPRVARAVQKLGTDHKKLLEVLLVLQSLQGNGEDGYKAERAFYHYMGDVQKTKDHLAVAKQLLDLGFEEEQIVDALLKHDNDRDKALEELII